MSEHRAGDLARRVARRSEELGLSREAVEAKAGMASGYLEYLQRDPSVNIGTEALVRLAAALETTPGALRGGDVDVPPGDQAPAANPTLAVLGGDECTRLLGDRGVGRFVFHSERGPVALPVNYITVDGEVMFRTAAGTTMATAVPDAPVSFEVDHIDDALKEGWSVLLTGRVQPVDHPERYEQQLSQNGPQPWAGGDRPVLLRLIATEQSGRRIIAR